MRFIVWQAMKYHVIVKKQWFFSTIPITVNKYLFYETLCL